MLVNCKNCDRAYNQVGPKKLCPPCRETYMSLFKYMTEKPEATLAEIEKNLGLSVAEVKVFLRHGRFVAFESLSKQVMKCIRCGAPPEHGDLCQGCFEALVTELVDELDPEARAQQEA